MLKQQQQELYGDNKKSMGFLEHSRASCNFFEASNGLTKRSHVPSGRSFPMTKMSHRIHANDSKQSASHDLEARFKQNIIQSQLA